MTIENSNKAYKPIRIREVFASKNPGLARLMPGFVFRYLNNILHLNEVNAFLKKHGHLKGIEFVDKVVEEFNVHEHIHNSENIPESGRYIFASNHPLGGFDGMLLMKIVEKRLGAFKFLANDILLNIPQLEPVFAPVNKHGSHARKAARLLSECYNSEAQILIFPSGLASRKIKGKIVDLEWKKHFISKAIKHKRDVIPVFVSGGNSKLFYGIAKFRKFFKIKWNLEMFLLPSETMKHKNTDVHLYFGKPISYKTFDKTKTHQEWASWVREKAYALKENSGSAN